HVLSLYGGWRGIHKYVDDNGGGPRTSFNLVRGSKLPKFKEPRYKKLFERAAYKAVLDVTPTFVRQYTNALMWKVTTYMIHPTLDRFISIRELMNMMGLPADYRSEEHTSELQSRENLVCRLLLEKKKKN